LIRRAIAPGKLDLVADRARSDLQGFIGDVEGKDLFLSLQDDIHHGVDPFRFSTLLNPPRGSVTEPASCVFVPLIWGTAAGGEPPEALPATQRLEVATPIIVTLAILDVVTSLGQ